MAVAGRGDQFATAGRDGAGPVVLGDEPRHTSKNDYCRHRSRSSQERGQKLVPAAAVAVPTSKSATDFREPRRRARHAQARRRRRYILTDSAAAAAARVAGEITLSAVCELRSGGRDRAE